MASGRCLLERPAAEIDPIRDASVDATVDVEEHAPNITAMVKLEELGRNMVVEVIARASVKSAVSAASTKTCPTFQQSGKR
jgi:hypothetical protein